MGTLNDDLSTYWNEAYSKHDLHAGIKLIGEVVGGVAVMGLLATALTVWIPGLGIPISTGIAARVMQIALRGYSQMDTEQRRQVRAVVRWVNGGVHFLTS